MADGKPRLNRDQIIRKALDAQHRVAFTVERAVPASEDEDNRTIELSFASDTPVTHFLWSRWEYVDIELSMDKKAVRTERLKNGAAFLMDHNPGDQRGVVDSFTIAKPKSRAEVRLSKNSKGEELLTDIRDGIRLNISVGFMIHKLVLIEERKNEPDLYRATDWEPYEISSVAIPADLSVGVARAMQMRAEGGETCPDCSEPLADCTCEPESNSNASRQQRAISTQLENKMKDKDGNEIPGTDPVVETRSAEVIARDAVMREIGDTAKALGDPTLEHRFHQKRLLEQTAGDPSVDEFKAFARSLIPPTTKVPTPPVEFRATGEHVEIDRRTRQIVEQETQGLTDAQMNAVFSREYREAFTMYVRKKGQRDLSPSHLRAISEGVDSEGGFLVPAEFLAKMVEREPASTELQNMVTGLTCGTDKLTMPKNAYSASDLYTTGIRVQWVDEKTGPTSEADPSDFGNITIPVHTAMMYCDPTKNMIEDSAFDIMGWLADKFRETSDVVTENMIINGNGIGQPAGILLNPNGTDEPATVVSGSAATVTADGLLDLTYALLGRYTRNARFVFNRTSTEKAIAKLKDSANRYLFSSDIVNGDGLATARPTQLLGFPITSSDFMPSLGANTFPIIFGDPKGYYLVRRIGFSIEILDQVVATANKVRVLGRMRIGGQVAEDWRLKIQKCST